MIRSEMSSPVGLAGEARAGSIAENPARLGCDLSILMPCLNEAETLVACIEKARRGIELAGVDGEVVVADNGSTDGSIALAEAHGARVVHIPAKGYGSALRGAWEKS